MVKVDVLRTIGAGTCSNSGFFAGDNFFRAVVAGDFNGVSINKARFAMNQRDSVAVVKSRTKPGLTTNNAAGMFHNVGKGQTAGNVIIGE